MGRSVSYPSGAIVAFTSFDFNADPEDIDEMVDESIAWDDFVDDLRARVKGLYPSAYDHDGWIGREDHVIARNSHCDFGVSQYFNLVAVWMRLRDDLQANSEGLAEAWVNKVTPRFLSEFGTLELIGRASNGEAFYAPAK